MSYWRLRCFFHEYAFILSYILVTIPRKLELTGKWSSSPTSFEGWQSFFSFVIFICLLFHPKIRNEVKILNKVSFIFSLPVSISYTIAAATGATVLSNLPIAVVLACSNFCPAVLAVVSRRNKSFKSPVVLGSAAVCLSIVIIFVIHSTEMNRLFYLLLLIHVVMNLVQSLLLNKAHLQVTDFTVIFYNNLLCSCILLPISVYNSAETNLELGNILPCFVTGFFSLAIQIFGFLLKAKNTKYLFGQGFAQLFTIVASFYMFESTMNIWIWCLVGMNWFATSLIVNGHDEDPNKNKQFILVVPQVSKNLYVEKYVNYNDMA